MPDLAPQSGNQSTLRFCARLISVDATENRDKTRDTDFK